MSRKNVVLIGGGQLGSRHLQAIAKCDTPLCIEVIDPSDASLSLCRERVAEIAGWERHEYRYQQTLSDTGHIDFAVIATRADVRRASVESLLSKSDVGAILLEKVLFQSVTDCLHVGQLLEEKNVKTWVNAPRRMWPIHKTLKELFADEPLRGISVYGSNWGMACNAYHFLDLLVWFAGSDLAQISSDYIVMPPVQAKRAGHYELRGALLGKTASAVTFALYDQAEGAKPMRLIIETDKRLIEIDESRGRVALLSGEVLPNDLADKSFGAVYQSDLTHHVAEDIFQSGSCQLTSYEESSLIHQSMLAAFEPCFEGVVDEEGVCPIT